MRIIVAEMARLPEVGTLFRETVPEQSLASISTLLRRMGEQGIVAQIDEEAAARLFLGSLLTYMLLDGLLSTESVPLLPAPERLASIVDLFLEILQEKDWTRLI